MFAIASLLDPTGDQGVQKLWEQFELRCGLEVTQANPLPHFTWISAESYPLEQVEPVLARIAEETTPFYVRSAGLGIFTGAFPVVYVALIKNEALLHLHKLIWEHLQPLATAPNQYYNPDRWMPHITLALHGVQSDRLACAVADVVTQPIEYEILIDQFAILYQVNQHAGIRNHFRFAKNSQKIGG